MGFDIARSFEQIFHEVAQPVEQVAREAIQTAEQVAHEAIQTAEQVAHGVIQPIEQVVHAVAEPIEQVAREVIQPIEQLVQALTEPIEQVVDVASQQITSAVQMTAEQINLAELNERSGSDYPGSNYRPTDRKNWITSLGPRRLALNAIVWPGTHDSATNGIGDVATRPFAECQTLSIYDQLVKGVRLLDVRVREDRLVCHGSIEGYHVDVVLQDVKRFLSETMAEIIILEIRTEFGHTDPPEFDKYLVDRLGDVLIQQDDNVFGKTVDQVLPKRVVCFWKPRNSAAPQAGNLLWSALYLRDDWIDTDMPLTKFESNLNRLGEQPPASSRNFFYRVENTLTPQAYHPGLYFIALSGYFKRYARLFIAQCFSRGIVDRLQVFSTDFVDDDFVDACVGLTYARVEGNV